MHPPIAPHSQTYILTLVQPLYESLTFTEDPADDHLTQLLRVEAAKWACKLELEDCVNSGLQVFEEWKQSNDIRYLLRKLLHNPNKYIINEVNNKYNQFFLKPILSSNICIAYNIIFYTLFIHI